MFNHQSVRRTFLAGLLLCVSCSLLAQNPPQPAPPQPAGNGGYLSSTLPSVAGPPNDWDLQYKLGQAQVAEPETKPVTVKELEDTLAANLKASDTKLASILSGLYLTERVTAARLAKWDAALTGPEAREVMKTLSDASVFEPLPREDVPAVATPSLAEQKRMIAAVGNYLGKVLPSLPNLIASRGTTYFQDKPSLPQSPWANTPSAVNLSSPVADEPGSTQLRWPLHRAGTAKIQVANVNGKESTMKGALEPAKYASRLTTAGEFGPILYGVIMDAAHSNLSWTGWYPGSDGVLAVFKFDATKENSHFSLRQSASSQGQDQFVAYSGTFAIRPSDGAIVWLTVVAHPAPGDELVDAKLMVEYGPVEIGGRMYMCPVHGVALSRIPLQSNSKSGKIRDGRRQTHLNDIVFDQYHAFRSESRVFDTLTADLSKPPQPGTNGQEKPVGNAPAPSGAATESASWTDAVAEVTAPAESSFVDAVRARAASEATRPVSPPAAQTTTQAMTPAPDSTDHARTPSAENPAVAESPLRMNVDLVLVPVVVRNEKSLEPVGGLKKDDFQIYDNKKLQEITSFTVETWAGRLSAKGTPQAGVSENIAPESIARTSEPRMVVYLFDDLHLTSADLLPLRDAALKNLEALQPNDLAALISTSGQVVLQLTTDRQKLRDALMKIHPTPLTETTQAECPDISYSMALKILSEGDDGEAMVAATQEATNCRIGLRNMQAEQPQIGQKVARDTVKLAARRARSIGEQESRAAITRTREVVDWLGKMPGKKSVILISPGFLVEPDKQSDIASVIDKAIRAEVAMSAIDVRGLNGGNPSRDIQKAVTHDFGFAQMMSRMATEEAIEIPRVMEELAHGTGGEFITNTGDFSWALQRLLSPPEFTYVLGFKPTKRDGKLHDLTVKISEMKGVTLQSRQAYVASKNN